MNYVVSADPIPLCDFFVFHLKLSLVDVKNLDTQR